MTSPASPDIPFPDTLSPGTPAPEAELRGRTALVTGSSRGIGRAIAVLFARRGAAVVLHGRDGTALTEVHDQITAEGGRAVTVTADVTDARDVERLREQAEEALGSPDVLVVNAGGSPVRPGPIEDITEDDWRVSVEANLTATFLTVKAFLPGMKRRGSGSIITMSSAAARRPYPGAPVAYAAAKAAVELFTKALATQAGPFGVRANCLAPETILTERNEQQIPPDLQEQLVAAHPLRRLGIPLDVAAAALFLATDQSAWITGVVLDVAGGAVLV
jgi:3-oxoacyl-[acyl-carrier protein] reductase